jgi:hypothetical protein
LYALGDLDAPMQNVIIHPQSSPSIYTRQYTKFPKTDETPAHAHHKSTFSLYTIHCLCVLGCFGRAC